MDGDAKLIGNVLIALTTGPDDRQRGQSSFFELGTGVLRRMARSHIPPRIATHIYTVINSAAEEAVVMSMHVQGRVMPMEVTGLVAHPQPAEVIGRWVMRSTA